MKGGKMEKSVQITLTIVAGIVILALIGTAVLSSIVPSQANTISVTGEATIDATPDLVAIYFNVETKGNTSETASDANAEIVDQLIINVLREGFERKDIQTQSFNVYPEYSWINNQRKENGFRATHSIRIEMSTDDASKIGEVVDAGINAGAGVGYINFELSQENQNKYKAEAMKSAAEDAKIKAEAVADGFDKRLGRLVSTSVDDYGYSPWRLYGAMATMEEAKQVSTDIQPSEQEITARVTAVYKIY